MFGAISYGRRFIHHLGRPGLSPLESAVLIGMALMIALLGWPVPHAAQNAGLARHQSLGQVRTLDTVPDTVLKRAIIMERGPASK